MKDLLICIAFHYTNQERLDCLIDVLTNIKDSYTCSYDIIIDTNLSHEIEGELIIINRIKNICDNTEIFSHHGLQFNLVMCHRKHMKKKIADYKNFMYIEDDMKVPYKTYLNYIDNFNILFPEYVSGAIRLETKNNQDYYILDCSHRQKVEEGNIVRKGDKVFFKSGNPYHAFWIMPQEHLKSTMVSDFDREDIHMYREIGASYPSMEVLKSLNSILVEVVQKDGGWYIHEDCYAYHVSNTYINNEGHQSRIPIQQYFTNNQI